MTLVKFTIEYKTRWGEELYVYNSSFEWDSVRKCRALELSTVDGVTWRGEVSLDCRDEFSFKYYYFIKEKERIIRKEEGPQRILFIHNKEVVDIIDSWREDPLHSYLYSSVFKENIFKRSYKTLSLNFPKSIVLNISCPYTKENEYVAIVGENKALGNWDVKKAKPLTPVRFGEWQIELNANEFKRDTPYKFIIKNCNTLSEVHWEEGENRMLKIEINPKDREAIVEINKIYRYHQYRWKGKGVAIPIFSLRSETSAGIGDFHDLKKIIDWAYQTQQQVVQLLPINDTCSTGTWRDSYPYNSISTIALNPIYIAISKLSLQNNKKQNKYIKEREKLNSLEVVDYEQVSALKINFLRDLYEESGEDTIQSKNFRSFYRKNSKWLIPYACFSYLRDKYKTANYNFWHEHAKYQPDVLDKIISHNRSAKREIYFYLFLQYIAHQQLLSAKKYAQSKRVALKGDIPIGINKYSVEAWTEPNLFNLNMQTGAPPDDFAEFGQNWGFPTYNWEAMAKDNYDWWRRRLENMSEYFDAYRIDHILGFFRIWEIPLSHRQAILGHFNPALPFTEEDFNYFKFKFDKERMTKPYIDRVLLEDVFNESVEEIIEKYLDVMPNNRFQLKQFCNTQKKINALFDGDEDLTENSIRDGLYKLCTEVLFVQDPISVNHFHPRIAAQKTYSFSILDEKEKKIYNEIYNDFFFHRHNYFWYKEAKSKLPFLLSSTHMLVCGEDLGMVPKSVEWLMNELKILSLEIERMPKKEGVLFTDFGNLPYLSVLATSTHDMSTIREWWQENNTTRQYYFNHILKRDGDAPFICSAEICEEIIVNHLKSNSMWCILPLQDWLSIDENLRKTNPYEERINDPSNSNHYWRYRMHITIEELLKKHSLNNRIKNMARV